MVLSHQNHVVLMSQACVTIIGHEDVPVLDCCLRHFTELVLPIVDHHTWESWPRPLPGQHIADPGCEGASEPALGHEHRRAGPAPHQLQHSKEHFLNLTWKHSRAVLGGMGVGELAQRA